MKLESTLYVALYALGVISASLVGFLCPWWFLGFAPLSAGLIWAAYDLDLAGVTDGKSPTSPGRRF